MAIKNKSKTERVSNCHALSLVCLIYFPLQNTEPHS